MERRAEGTPSEQQKLNTCLPVDRVAIQLATKS